MLIVKPDPQNEYSDSKLLNAYIDDDPAGFISFHLRGYIIVIDELLPLPENPAAMDGESYALLDTIIRALGSYGLNHNCYYLECENPMLYPTLEKLRFGMKNGMMQSTLKDILKQCH